jgi:hypothetical protein
MELRSPRMAPKLNKTNSSPKTDTGCITRVALTFSAIHVTHPASVLGLKTSMCLGLFSRRWLPRGIQKEVNPLSTGYVTLTAHIHGPIRGLVALVIICSTRHFTVEKVSLRPSNQELPSIAHAHYERVLLVYQRAVDTGFHSTGLVFYQIRPTKPTTQFETILDRR